MKKVRKIIAEHISNNKKEYIIFSLMFIIGLFLGVFCVNNIEEGKMNEVTTYFSSSIENLKQTQNLEYMEILQKSITKNITQGTTLWFLGTTIIGIPIVMGIVAYKGFCIGYTIGATVLTLGKVKGISFILASLLLHNIIFIPSILAIGVSGFKLYKSIVKDKRKKNIKIEIIRHTVFSFIMLVALVVSSVLETFGTTNFILLIIKYL